jgi:hypothetical protein
MLVVPGAGSVLTESEPMFRSFVLTRFLHANRHPLRAKSLPPAGSFPTHKAGAREIKTVDCRLIGCIPVHANPWIENAPSAKAPAEPAPVASPVWYTLFLIVAKSTQIRPRMRQSGMPLIYKDFYNHPRSLPSHPQQLGRMVGYIDGISSPRHGQVSSLKIT